MSIKIYSGYKLPSMSSYELQLFFQKLRKKLDKKKTQLYYEVIACDFMKKFDNIWLDKMPFKYYKEEFEDSIFSTEEYIKNKISLYRLVTENIQKKYAKIHKTGERNIDYDFQFTVSVIPQKDKILCITYSEQQSFTDIWESTKLVDFYGYWNNTDRPDELTQKEWSARYREWNKALKDFGPSILAGFTWSLNTDSRLDGFPFSVEDFDEVLVLLQNSKNKRAISYGKDVLLNKKMEEYQKRNGIKKEDIKEISDSGYFEASDFVNSDEGKQIINKIAVEIEKKLVDFNKADVELTYSQIVDKRPKDISTFLESL